MTWKSHTAIATALILPFNPALIPIASLGATAPDWLEYVLKFFGVEVEHRKETHYLIVPLIIIAISLIIDFKSFLFWFGIGYFSHWFADSLTRTGVPLSPWDNHRIHFFGGKLTTGEPLEYIISFAFLGVIILIFKGNLIELNNQNGVYKFEVYNNNYQKMYDEKIIDEKEYKENRFKFF